MNDEMEDEDRDLKAPSPLGAYLQLCQSRLGRLYQHADDEALRYQNAHRRLTWWAACFGTLVLVLTSFNIVIRGFDPAHAKWYTHLLLWVELICALVLVALVWRGICLKSRKEWLLWRYRAEQYRLLKFRFLIEPGLWSARPALADGTDLLGEIEEIHKLDYGAIEERAGEEKLPKNLSAESCARG